jgi:DNA-binding PadR family transcriptional regulator
MSGSVHSLLPLSPTVLHILLALVDQERHGYGIVVEVERQSKGTHKLLVGTLYYNLDKLLEAGLIEVSPNTPSGDSRRRDYYRLTSFGRSVLAAEMARLEQLFRKAKRSLRHVEESIS